MSRGFEYNALESLTDWLTLWLCILLFGIHSGWPLVVLAPILGLVLGLLPVCGRYRVVPGENVRVVRRD